MLLRLRTYLFIDRQQQEYQEASTGRLMVKKSENEALHRQEQALKQQVQVRPSRVVLKIS